MSVYTASHLIGGTFPQKQLKAFKLASQRNCTRIKSIRQHACKMIAILYQYEVDTYLAVTYSWIVFGISHKNIVQSRLQVNFLFVGKVYVIWESAINV